MSKKMLILNLGSTSTKVAVYEDKGLKWSEKIEHNREEINRNPGSKGQLALRMKSLERLLAQRKEDFESFDVFVSRGGTIRPVKGGTWLVTDGMVEDANSKLYGEHPCNLGLEIVKSLAEKYDKTALTVDPPISNEMCVEATYTGIPGVKRMARFHALNQRAIARKYAEDIGVKYEDLNLIVAHMGGGISVGAHEKGKITDVNNALEGDGPFAMERAGTVPTGDLINLCYSSKYNAEKVRKTVNGAAGVLAYLNTTDAIAIGKQIQAGDKKAEEVIRAMAYQVAKEIASLTAVLRGKVDAIILTGGLAHWDYFVELVSERVSHLGKVCRYPGENEMESLACGALRALSGEEPMQKYDDYYPR